MLLAMNARSDIDLGRMTAGRRDADSARAGILEVVDIHKAFGARKVLRGLSLQVGQGEIVGLFGRDGAGKSVAMYCILGLLKCDAGRIVLDGADVSWLPFYRRAMLGLGYLPEQPSIFRGLTVSQNIMSMLEIVEPDRDRREGRLEQLLVELGIEALRDSRATALSGGERRKCEVARALALVPKFLLLDEPFAGIDPLAVASIQQMVRDFRKRGIGVLITDQNVREMLAVIDRAIVMEEGATGYCGSPADMLRNEHVLATYLGNRKV